MNSDTSRSPPLRKEMIQYHHSELIFSQRVLVDRVPIQSTDRSAAALSGAQSTRLPSVGTDGEDYPPFRKFSQQRSRRPFHQGPTSGPSRRCDGSAPLIYPRPVAGRKMSLRGTQRYKHFKPAGLPPLLLSSRISRPRMGLM